MKVLANSSGIAPASPPGGSGALPDLVAADDRARRDKHKRLYLQEVICP
jgi:hypothetical protein